MIDGGMSDRTARMFDAYLDEPDNKGTWVVEPKRLVRLIRWVHDLGWPMDIHTCGDEAQETVVQAFADAQRRIPSHGCGTGCIMPIFRRRRLCRRWRRRESRRSFPRRS